MRSNAIFAQVNEIEWKPQGGYYAPNVEHEQSRRVHDGLSYVFEIIEKYVEETRTGPLPSAFDVAVDYAKAVDSSGLRMLVQIDVRPSGER